MVRIPLCKARIPTGTALPIWSRSHPREAWLRPTPPLLRPTPPATCPHTRLPTYRRTPPRGRIPTPTPTLHTILIRILIRMSPTRTLYTVEGVPFSVLLQEVD